MRVAYLLVSRNPRKLTMREKLITNHINFSQKLSKASITPPKQTKYQK